MNLDSVADSIMRYLKASPKELMAQTGIRESDFIPIEPLKFDGRIFAVDGSNIEICDLSVIKMNHIRAGYVVYRGSRWEKTVITYDDLFLADRMNYIESFRKPLEIFGLEGLALSGLRGSELDRLSTYFRELQEYVALNEALNEMDEGDLLLYDGGFALWKDRPFGKVLERIFERASKRGVYLLGVSKSSSIYWGREISMPLVYHLFRFGRSMLPGRAWYVNLRGKYVKHDPLEEIWRGSVCIAMFHPMGNRAFRVDLPAYLEEQIPSAIAKASAFSGSSECMGYPHALFRAHRDIRIKAQEGEMSWMRVLDALSPYINISELDGVKEFHEILESHG